MPKSNHILNIIMFSKTLADFMPESTRNVQKPYGLRYARKIRQIFLVSLLIVSTASSAHAIERALWVWSMGPKIIEEINTNDRSDFFSFVAAPHGDPDKAITTIFLYLNTNSADEICIDDEANCRLRFSPRVREFIADAHSRGLEVHFLDGDPTWGLAGVYQEPGRRTMQAVLNYNANSLPEERIDGIQFDVEPYLLQSHHPLSWELDRDEVWRQYVESLRKWQAMVDEHNLREKDQIRFGVAFGLGRGARMLRDSGDECARSLLECAVGVDLLCPVADTFCESAF